MTYFKVWTVTGFPRGATAHDCGALDVVGESKSDDDVASAENAIAMVRQMFPKVVDAQLKATKATKNEV